MYMFTSRKCALCEYVVEMVDRKLQNNPFVDWKPIASFVGEAGAGSEADAETPHLPKPPHADRPASEPAPPPWRRPPPDPAQPATPDELRMSSSQQTGLDALPGRDGAGLTAPMAELLQVAAGEGARMSGAQRVPYAEPFNTDLNDRVASLSLSAKSARMLIPRAMAAEKDANPRTSFRTTLADDFSVGKREVPAAPLDLDSIPNSRKALKRGDVPEASKFKFPLFLQGSASASERNAEALQRPSLLETEAISSATREASVTSHLEGLIRAETLLRVEARVAAALRHAKEQRSAARARASSSGANENGLADLDDAAAKWADESPASLASLLQLQSEPAFRSFSLGRHLGDISTPALDASMAATQADAQHFAARFPSVAPLTGGDAAFGGSEPSPGAGAAFPANSPLAAQSNGEVFTQRFRSVLDMGFGPPAAGSFPGMPAQQAPAGAYAGTAVPQAPLLQDGQSSWAAGGHQLNPQLMPAWQTAPADQAFAPQAPAVLPASAVPPVAALGTSATQGTGTGETSPPALGSTVQQPLDDARFASRPQPAQVDASQLFASQLRDIATRALPLHVSPSGVSDPAPDQALRFRAKLRSQASTDESEDDESPETDSEQEGQGEADVEGEEEHEEGEAEQAQDQGGEVGDTATAEGEEGTEPMDSRAGGSEEQAQGQASALPPPSVVPPTAQAAAAATPGQKLDLRASQITAAVAAPQPQPAYGLGGLDLLGAADDATDVLPADPEDAMFRPAVGSEQLHFDTGAAGIAAASRRSKHASMVAGRAPQAGTGASDPASLDYVAAAPLPVVEHRISPRDHFRLQHRLSRVTAFFKVYQHVMDALEDVCQGLLPRLTAQSCGPIYARAQLMTMWMQHGYQADEICTKMAMCMSRYFDVE